MSSSVEEKAVARKTGGSADRPRLATAAGMLCLALVVAFGLWRSLAITYATWPIDSDLLGIQSLLQAMREHGVKGVTTWYFTADSWILSLAPVLAGFYALAGTSAEAVLAGGWGIHIAAVLAVFFLAKSFLRPLLAAFLAAAFLFANPMALGQVGFLTYPVTHNSSEVWALLALIAALRAVALNRQGRGSAGSYAFLVVAGAFAAVSDPWAKAAFVLPLLLASAFLLLAPFRWRRGRDLLYQLSALLAGIRRQPVRRAYLGLFLSMLLAWWLAEKRLIGILYFLPPYRLKLAGIEDMAENVWWLAQTFGRLFYVLPGLAVSDLSAGLSALVLAGLVCRAILRLAPGYRSFGPELRLFVLAASLSVGGTLAAAVIGLMPHSITIGRFFANGFFLLPCLFVLAETAGRRRAMWLPAAWGGLVILAGFLATDLGWHPAAPQIGRAATLVPYLEAHGLDYGYGPYHTTPTAAVDWYSGGKVVVRPVKFDPQTGEIVGQHEESSPFWRLAEDAPPGQKRFFVVIGNDIETCPSISLCKEGMTRQFGPPAETLPYDDGAGALDILVWDHPLVSEVTGRTDGQLRSRR